MGCCCPPSYAPEIESFTTWYDQAFNVAAMAFSPRLMTNVPSFTRDIYPILKRVVLISWLVEKKRRHHNTGENFLNPGRLNRLADKSSVSKPFRQAVFSRLMKPGTFAGSPEKEPPAPQNMPYLYSGLDPDNPSQAEFAALTSYQYTMMERWAQGNFEADWNGEPAPVPFDELPLNQQPDALTRAALEGCIGAPFYPGIEVTYMIAQTATYETPFRIRQTLPPGFLTERMALPWQADFVACGELWWPAQRPVEVVTAAGIQPFSRGIRGGDNGYVDMVRWWTELGFIVKKGDQYVEDERRPIAGET